MTETTLAAASALVKGDLIAAAHAKHEAAFERLRMVEGELETARAIHKAAVDASERAIGGDGDPHKAELGLETAARALSVATRVRDAAEAARVAAYDAITTERGVAHQPVARAGIVMRLAAAKKADAARAMLAEAEGEFATGNAMLTHARENYVPDTTYDQWSKPMGTHATEAAMWANPNGWWFGSENEGV